jgi:DNA-binding HxlR family transcriptional regulator
MSRNNHEHIDYEHDLFAELCPCRSLLDLLGNKWSTLTIGALDEGPQRFGELQHKLAGVSPKVLTQTLRRLENSGFVNRTVFPEVPLHVEYSLTELGHSANVPLAHLRNWALDNITRVPGLNPAGTSP